MYLRSKSGRNRILLTLVPILLAISLVVAGCPAQVASTPTPVGPEPAKNVILLIGDGMSFSTVTAARVYKVGPDGNLVMDTLAHHGWISTHSLNSLVTDSAAAGTALATGHKTNNGMLGMLPDGTELRSILDIARNMGKSTGLVTTSRITHATPAAFGARSEDRDNWDDIANDYIYRSLVDVIMGGGLRDWLDDQAKEFPVFVTDPAKESHRTVERLMKQGLTEAEAKADDGLIDDAQRQGYEVIYTKDGLTALNMASLFGEKSKLLGLFALCHMTYELEREDKAPHEPHLATMTKAALGYLSQDEDGFFLMVEGARIDHAQHGNYVKRMIYDTLAFDKAVKVALDFQRKNPDTLVIVTSDHDTGGMAVEWPVGEFPPYGEIPIGNADRRDQEILDGLAGILTPEAMELVQRLHRDGVWTSGDHTAVDVPIMATGPGAERVSGRMDNTDVFEVMRKAMER
ncbi:MAG: Alkaline phosphatase 4 [Dehalococcoidia bacterium]|nr:Alkaline phosphatase 4 [Bacillota bacterium]MBT9143757.1 Alkaline phosphatase 4 [Bacillota bacterium]